MRTRMLLKQCECLMRSYVSPRPPRLILQNPGECDGLTPEEIQQRYPEEFELRRLDKLHYRYRGNGGESYLDVVFRLQGVIVEIERLQTHVLLIAHRVVARILLAYYLNLSHHVSQPVSQGLM